MSSNSNLQHGAVVLSLDFELIWGIFDHFDLSGKCDYFDRTLEAIPRLLDLFALNQMQVTWATVGMLFQNGWDDWLANRPGTTPKYVNRKLDPYAFALTVKDKSPEKYFFAPALVEKIASTPGQEMATHTYSHFYCQESGQDIKDFDDDLRMAVQLASQLNIQLRSLVFPRNQFNPEYLSVCARHGIANVRTNPAHWYWRDPKGNLASKIFRTADAYGPFRSKAYDKSAIEQVNGICLQPASRFLRPYRAKPALLEKLRLNRVMNEMTDAAKHGKIYHLWWHPHNFGNHPTESMAGLRRIVEHFRQLNDQYGFESKSMGELGNELQEANGEKWATRSDKNRI